MIKNSVLHSRRYRFLTVALVAAIGFGFGQIVFGQSAAPVPEPGVIAAAGAPVPGGVVTAAAGHDPAALASANWTRMVGDKKSDGSVNQGVKMHGHWVIDIRNPDGTLTAHRDFENSLEGGAQGFLIGLMSGYLVPGDYMIIMGPQSGNGACVATYQWCGIVRSLSTYPGLGYCGSYYCATGLNYTYNLGSLGAGTGPFSMVLSGSITANQTGTIGTVYTAISTCANIAFSTTINPSSVETNSPASCVPQTSPVPWYGPLSQANVTPVSVDSGQIVQVTVTITFS